MIDETNAVGVDGKALPYVKDETVLSVCGWCHPGKSILDAYPHLAAFPLSHGICPACREAIKRDIKPGA